MYDPYNPYETGNFPKIEVNFKRNRISTKKTGIGTVNAGGAIIIIIFVVLCLTIFGLLSFTTSFADKKLADKNMQSVSRYYKADSEAEEILAMLYDSIYTKIQTASVSGGLSDFGFLESAIADIPGDIGIGDMEELGGGESTATVFYATDMSDSEIKFHLSSEVKFFYNENTNELSYKITEWRVVMDSEFDYDSNPFGVGGAKLWDFGADENENTDEGSEYADEGLFDFWNSDGEANENNENNENEEKEEEE